MSRPAAPEHFCFRDAGRRKSGPIFRPDFLVARDVSPAAQLRGAGHRSPLPRRDTASAFPLAAAFRAARDRHAPHPFSRLLAAVLALGAPVLAHADTSATLATAINLPKGPASIEGFGRAYEVSPASGLPG
jgi:hypothetical protein